MSLTFADLIADWNRSTGADESSAGVSVVEGINDALDYVSSMHQWRGLLRSATPLATVAGQSYIDLPLDCAKIISIRYTDGNWRGMEFVSQETLADFRTTNIAAASYTGTYVGSISYRTTDTGAVPTLDVYPNIAATSASTFQITYRRRLLLTAVGTAADTTVLDVPVYMRQLVRSIVRIFAKGIEEEDDGSLWARIEEIERSRMLHNIKTTDGGMQPSIGQMRGGAAQYRGFGMGDTDDELAPPS